MKYLKDSFIAIPISLDEFKKIHLRNLLDEKLFNENVFFVAKEIINSIT